VENRLRTYLPPATYKGGGMNIINEKEMIKILKKQTKICLIQPKYKTKYPPLGLGKIKSYATNRNIYVSETPSKDCSLFCVSSLFTYESKHVFDAIDEILDIWNGKTKTIIGGVFASLMPSPLHDRYGNDILIFKGYSKILDECPPILNGWPIDKGFKDYCFVFTTRGCPNKCAYCAVHRIEKEPWLNAKWKDHIDDSKKVVMVSDNNLSSWGEEHISDVVNTITSMKKKIVFDNGLDCKLIDDKMAKILSVGKYTRCGMRLAFDRIEEDGIFQKAVETLISSGIPKSQIMAYVLFNFTDTPEEANYRMEECKRLGIRPYPQQYTPLNKLQKKNKHIGKHWDGDLLKHFRHFWLMAGYWSKMTFNEWAKKNELLQRI
jgi:hypothetical protein